MVEEIYPKLYTRIAIDARLVAMARDIGIDVEKELEGCLASIITHRKERYENV